MHILNYVLKYKLLLAVLIPAFIFHMLIALPSGNYYCHEKTCGLFFWGAHGHDSIWHLALSEKAFTQFPFQLPTFSGGVLQGYNILMDIVIYLLSLIGIPSIFSLFKLFPLVWFASFVYFGILLARKIKNSPLFVGLLLFFFFFAGSFGYFLTLYHNQTLNDSESLLAMQSAHMLLNIQFAFSLTVLIGIMYLIHDAKITMKKTLILGILTAAAIGMKFYGGVISLFMVELFYALSLLKNRKLSTIVHMVSILVFAGLSTFIFYNPLESVSKGALFTFAPFATMHAFIEERHLLYLKDMVNARYFLQSHGWSPRLFAIEIFTAVAYMFFNFGVRVFGFIYLLIKLKRKQFSMFDLIVLLTIIFSIMLPVLFIQRGVWWNSIQFLYYGLFLANIFVAQFIYECLTKKSVVLKAFAVLLIILSLPINFDMLKKAAKFPAPAYLPQKEMEALEFLKKQPSGVVLTNNFQKELMKEYKHPIPLYAYEGTSYVTAFSKQQTYVADTMQLGLLGAPYEERLAVTDVWNCDMLKKIDVDYIYEVIPMRQKKNFKDCSDKLETIFTNGMTLIYKVK